MRSRTLAPGLESESNLSGVLYSVVSARNFTLGLYVWGLTYEVTFSLFFERPSNLIYILKNVNYRKTTFESNNTKTFMEGKQQLNLNIVMFGENIVDEVGIEPESSRPHH